jgi:hypothetical protein
MIKFPHLSVTLIFCLLTSCALIAPFDQPAYEHAVNAKVDTLALVNKATGNYSDNVAEIAKVNLELQKAYEYDKGRALNTKTTEMWELLLVENPAKPDFGIFPHFLERWKKKGSLRMGAIADVSKNASDAFDEIIQLESGKSHATQTN